MIMRRIFYYKCVSLLLVFFIIGESKAQISGQGFEVSDNELCSRGIVTLTYTPNGTQMLSEIKLYRNNSLIDNVVTNLPSYTYSDYPVNNTGGTITITYSIEVTMTDGTIITDNVSVLVYPAPQLSVSDFIVSDVSCNGSYDGTITPNFDYFTGNNPSNPILNYSYTQNSTYTQVTTPNFSLNGLSGGNYYFYIYITEVVNNNPLMCSSDTITVTVVEPQNISYNSASIINDNCGQDMGMVIFHGLTGGVPPYTFTDGSTTTYTSVNDSMIVNLGNNSYSFTIVDANGCNYFLSPPQGQNAFIIIDGNEEEPEIPDLPTELTICENQFLQITDNSGLPHFYYFSGANNTLFYSPTSTINVDDPNLLSEDFLYVYAIETTGNSAGCVSDTVAIDLVQKDCSFNPDSVDVTYNAFSPNDPNPDNSTFVIDLEYIDDPEVTDVNVTIYNRWGDIVYITDNYDNSKGWNGGLFNESSLPEGTYYYIIKVNSKKYVKSGWVYLDR